MTTVQDAYELIADLHDLAGRYEVANRPMRDSIENRMYDMRCALNRMPQRIVRIAQQQFDRDFCKWASGQSQPQ